MKLATLCYLRRDGKTLMLYRNRQGDYHQGKYNALGGKLEAGDSPEDCVRREVFEESGLTVARMELKGILTFPMFDGRDDWYVFVYIIPEFGGELRDSPEGNLEWIPDERLLDLDLWPGDRIFMPWLEASPFFSAKFFYQGGELVGHEANFY